MNTLKSKLIKITASIFLTFSINVFCQTGNTSIDYFSQTPSGENAIVFAPDFISLNNIFVQTGTYSPDGKEYYFTVTNGRWDSFKIWFTKFVNGKWSTPLPADFFGIRDNMEPFYSPDGKGIYYNSGDIKGTDIWYCSKEGNTWNEPVKLPEPVNTSGFEWYPSISKKNTLFLTRDGDIYSFSSQNGRFNSMVKISLPVNTLEYDEADPYISPNEDYLIFHSDDHPAGYGQGDLYISYKKDNGMWTNPKNLGTKINTAEFEFGPSVTPDGKYFLFSRRKQWITDVPSKIFWIKSDFIDSLKHTNFIPYLYNKISDQSAAAGYSFSYAVPENTFIDDDGNNTLAYSASLSNGSPLPAWLAFDPMKNILSGTPKETGSINVKITAADKAGGSASCTFKLEVK